MGRKTIVRSGSGHLAEILSTWNKKEKKKRKENRKSKPLHLRSLVVIPCDGKMHRKQNQC